uniref:Putative Hef-like homing endonuclease n=1 Tax=viral metagenome TaxID=1070528 RepID=A0A6M3KWD9_9ZZZZ
MIIKAWKIKNGNEVLTSLLGTIGYKSCIKVLYECENCGKRKEVSLESLIKHNRLKQQVCLSCSILLNDIASKRKNTIIRKYGVDAIMKVPEFQRKHKNNTQLRNSFEKIKEFFVKNNCQLITTIQNYEGNKKPIKYLCQFGHEQKANWNDLITEKRTLCKICNKTKGWQNIKLSQEDVKNCLEKEGYILLSKYINSNIKVKALCPNNHLININIGNFRSNGTRCPYCFTPSRAEEELYNFIKSYYPEAISRNRTLISPYELDIYIPSKGVAIEYCGLYFHSEGMGKDKNYHLNKLKRCQEQGVQLITIFEDEWLYKKDIVTSRLKSYLNISTDRVIYARKCEIREINTKTKDLFLEENHLQGKDGSSVKLGAFYDGELVSVMTFSKPNIAKGGSFEIGKYELNRFCSKINVRVAGIASKLLKHFKGNYESNEIYSYSDRRWSVGNLYEVLSFQFSHHSAPSYWYIIDTQRVHRFNFRKGVLESKLETFNPDLTEYENMANNGYRRIWDCGNTKWLYKKELI